MPNLPYSLSTDRSDIHRKSGADLLIRLGRKLIELARERARHRSRGSEWVPDDLVEETGRIEDELLERFAAHPQARMKKYLLSTLRGGRKTTDVDIRAARVVGVMAAGLLEGRTQPRLMQLASASSLSDGPADVLEMRRVAARLCLDRVLAT